MRTATGLLRNLDLWLPVTRAVFTRQKLVLEPFSSRFLLVFFLAFWRVLLLSQATRASGHQVRDSVLTHAMESLPPLLVQKCLEFLPFAEVHVGVKQVSKATRKAARMALTRGRWRPFRYVAEQGLAVCAATGAGALKLDTDTFTVVCDDAASAVPAAARKAFREAWELEPSLVMRIICLDWDTSSSSSSVSQSRHMIREGRYQACFLRIVEPSIDGLSRIVGACECTYGGCTCEPARVIPRFFPRMLFFWWALIGQRTPDTLHSAVSDGLKDWADFDRTVNFLGVFIDTWEYHYGMGPHGYSREATARAWSANWADREKASRFVAAAEEIDEEKIAKRLFEEQRRLGWH